MRLHVQLVVSGLLQGGVYAVIALGLTLVFGVMRVINVAHGELVMLGAYTTFWVFALWQVNPLLTLLVSIPLLFFLGMVIERLLIARVVDQPEVTALLLTFGLSIFLVGTALNLWSADFRSVESPMLAGSVMPWLWLPGLGWLQVFIPKPRLISFLLSLLITGTVFAFLKYTRTGKAIRATAQSREVAMACGINVRRIYTLTFGLGAALAAAGGSLISLMLAIFPEMGAVLTLKSFCIIVLGGMGNYAGAFFGGLVLGLAETYGAFYTTPQLQEAFAYLLLILILLLKPSGLLGVVRQ
ncbi:MAG: branched-chain amino acid ABC transporter permease [Candidatus Tectimicrobiota bacterium]|nr:MAG: branched-chain amino acid ABC transporter permease [Candidatus Tectomicrobia bacterium]